MTDFIITLSRKYFYFAVATTILRHFSTLYMYHQNNFHFLRFFSALLVIFGHCYPLTGRGNLDYIQSLTAGLFPTAHIGVCIFFSISGYLIAKSLESNNYIDFFLKRFVRIMPGLVVAVLVTVFVIGPLVATAPLAEYFSAPGTYTYMKVIKLFPFFSDELPYVFKDNPSTLVNGSLWTLAYEVVCYGVLLAVGIVFRRYARFVLLALFAVIWVSFFYWFNQLRADPFLIRFIHLNLFDLLNFGSYFLVGSLIYYFRSFIALKWYWLVILFAVFMMSYVLSSFLGYIPLASIVWIRYLLIPYAILFFGFRKGILNRFGRTGDLSYGLYIYAYPVQQVIVDFYGPGIGIPAMFLSSVIVTLPLAWLSWHFVENPFLKLKKVPNELPAKSRISV